MGKNSIVLCDSNIIIKHIRRDVHVQKVLQDIGIDNIAISIITYSEIFMGTKENKKKATKKYLESFRICPLSKDISKKFKELINEYGKFRSQKWISDALIAATTIIYGYELYTENKQDFDFIKEIRFYNP